jgi:hypothetical protein
MDKGEFMKQLETSDENVLKRQTKMVERKHVTVQEGNGSRDESTPDPLGHTKNVASKLSSIAPSPNNAIKMETTQYPITIKKP